MQRLAYLLTTTTDADLSLKSLSYNFDYQRVFNVVISLVMTVGMVIMMGVIMILMVVVVMTMIVVVMAVVLVLVMMMIVVVMSSSWNMLSLQCIGIHLSAQHRSASILEINPLTDCPLNINYETCFFFQQHMSGVSRAS